MGSECIRKSEGKKMKNPEDFGNLMEKTGVDSKFRGNEATAKHY